MPSSPLVLQVPGHGSLEFNPLRLWAARKWLHDRGLARTSQLVLADGRNANAAIHHDDVCRPQYDAQTGRLLQRCISCVRLGLNRENARMSVRLQHERVSKMKQYIAATLQRDRHAATELDSDVQQVMMGVMHTARHQQPQAQLHQATQQPQAQQQAGQEAAQQQAADGMALALTKTHQSCGGLAGATGSSDGGGNGM